MNSPKTPITILIADDDEDDRDYIKRAWSKSRAINDLRFVEDGEELMDYLHRRGQYAPPAVAPRPGMILLDLNMPRMDGREALKEIKGDAELRQIPVIVLTTSKTEEDIFRSYDLGAGSFITKPVSFGALLEVIQVIKLYWVEIVDLPSSAVEV